MLPMRRARRQILDKIASMASHLSKHEGGVEENRKNANEGELRRRESAGLGCKSVIWKDQCEGGQGDQDGKGSVRALSFDVLVSMSQPTQGKAHTDNTGT